jgi:hypothetical protein
MANPYLIQLVGVILVAAGGLALTAAAHIFGTPLTREERLEIGKGDKNVYRLPINLETIASSAVFLAGMGILWWSKFNLCAFLAYWLPELPEAIRLFFLCRI